MKTFVTICVTLMLTVPELAAGNAGLSLGLPIFGAVYFAAACGLSYGICAAGGAGMLLDLLYSRSDLTGAFVSIAIMFLSCRAAVRMQRKMPAAPLAAGAVCGMLINLCAFASAMLRQSEPPGPDLPSLFIFQTSGGAVFMLLLTWLFDAVNFRSNLPRFTVSAGWTENPGGGRR